MSRAASGGLFQADKNPVLVTVVSEKESGLVEIPAAGIGIKKIIFRTPLHFIQGGH